VRNNNTPNSHRGLPVVPTACLLLFALALRLHHLDFESLWIDELLQVSFYAHPFDQIARHAAYQQQPPLDYWIGYWVSLLSPGDFAVRLPSAFFGVGAVFFVTLLAGNIRPLPIAYGAGILAALLPFNIHFSQEARPYSIAIFLFLALLWALTRLLDSSTGKRGKVLTLFLIAVAFLHSRGFEPLVITVLLIFILIVKLGFSMVSKGFLNAGSQRAVLYAAAALGLALTIYLPTFRTLLSYGDTYLAEKPNLLSLGPLLKGIEDFTLEPVILSFVFQTEPLTYPLIALLLLSPFTAWKMRRWPSHEVFVFCALLLPGISLLHLFIFQAYTDMPFKPQYSFYLLPLTLILSSVAFQGLWTLAGSLAKGRGPKAALIVAAALMVLWAADSTYSFKAFKKKEDWKGLCRYLAERYGPEQILLFDTLVPYGTWEGNFYGFRRYYHGNSRRLVVAQIPSFCDEMVRMDKEPVLILYHRAELCLTARSLYCRCLPPAARPEYFTFRPGGADDRISVTSFTGFQVVSLKKKGEERARDTYILLSASLLRLPGDSSITDLHLASAGLARVLGLPDWESHLISAEAAATDEQRSKMSGITKRVRDLRPISTVHGS
jgi:4-amino-4-deoxy-L-arabinose transferase-like glycosyltransferase